MFLEIVVLSHSHLIYDVPSQEKGEISGSLSVELRVWVRGAASRPLWHVEASNLKPLRRRAPPLLLTDCVA